MSDIEIRDIHGAKVELSDGMLPVITHLDIEAHGGNLYQAFHFEASVLDKGTVEVFLKNISSIKRYHAFFAHAAGGDALVELMENPTIIDNGTPLSIYNVNRESENISTAEAYYAPNLSGGVIILDQFSPGGTGGFTLGATGETLERQLPPNCNYWFRITNISGIAQPISATITFYEKSKK